MQAQKFARAVTPMPIDWVPFMALMLFSEGVILGFPATLGEENCFFWKSQVLQTSTSLTAKPYSLSAGLLSVRTPAPQLPHLVCADRSFRTFMSTVTNWVPASLVWHSALTSSRSNFR